MNERNYDELCRSASNATRLVQGKWRIPILCALQDGPVRLGQLARNMPHASKKVIAQNLKELENEGVLIRTDLSETRLHVEYDFSESIRSKMAKMLACLADVGATFEPKDQ